jgi:hypothetical protein
MKPYLKLVSYELLRIRRFYLALLAIVLLAQFTGIFLYTHSFMNRVNETRERLAISEAEYVTKNIGFSSFYAYTVESLWFIVPIAIAGAALLIYVFVIWYRDWFGRNTFIYRLLTLPASRIKVYLSKLSTIMLLILGTVAFQLMLLPALNVFFDSRLPGALITPVSVTETVLFHPFLRYLIPFGFTNFTLFYFLGLTALTVVFTAIVLERSYRLKGLAAGIGYVALSLLFFLIPFLFAKWKQYLLYPNELLIFQVIVSLIIISGSTAFSSYLLKHKITV